MCQVHLSFHCFQCFSRYAPDEHAIQNVVRGDNCVLLQEIRVLVLAVFTALHKCFKFYLSSFITEEWTNRQLCALQICLTNINRYIQYSLVQHCFIWFQWILHDKIKIYINLIPVHYTTCCWLWFIYIKQQYTCFTVSTKHHYCTSGKSCIELSMQITYTSREGPKYITCQIVLMYMYI